MPFNITIIGVGLIGGSFALGLKKQGVDARITGCSRNEKNLITAKNLNVIDDWTIDIAKAVTDADMVMLCVPMKAMKNIMSAIQPHIKSDCIITDAGSVKGCFVSDALDIFGAGNYIVPGHPIAGKETSGVESAEANLYQNKRVILTPLDDTDAQATAKVKVFWEVCGANVEMMGVEKHDQILASTSHLPHVLAFSLVNALNNMEITSSSKPEKLGESIFKYAAGGFRDFSRIAASDPVMWKDICITNKDAVLCALDVFQQECSNMKQAIENSNEVELLQKFEQSQSIRKRFDKNE